MPLLPLESEDEVQIKRVQGDICTTACSAYKVSIALSAGNHGLSKNLCHAKSEFYGIDNVGCIGVTGSYSGCLDTNAYDDFAFKSVDDAINGMKMGKT